MILKAIEFARDAHKGQLRKYTNKPYILHPARVAMRVSLIDGVSEEMICAAWLHDVIEDCGVTYETLQWEFGGKIAGMVKGLTDTTKHEFPHLNRAARKAITNQRLAQCGQSVQSIKLCDRIDNLSEIGGAPPDFYRLYITESRDLLGALLGGEPSLRDELAETIRLMEQGLEGSPCKS